MSSQAKRRLNNGAYTVALICPLEVEMSAARYMLDEEHERLPNDKHDTNSYILGQLSGHNVVIASLPEGSQGTVSAATVATHVARAFPAIELRLLIGVGGGVPSEKNDIRLGDVVVSTPSGTSGGVIEYDLGKQTPTGFERKGFLCPPPTEWRSVMTSMKSDHRTKSNRIREFLSDMLQKFPRLIECQRPLPEKDVLFQPDYKHDRKETTCANCDKSRAVNRRQRAAPDEPVVFYGLIASGNRVMKDAIERDIISKDSGGAICFEMEAAGLMNDFRCIVIRGISDYSDSHKNDDWHPYAAAAAAGLAKEILSYMDPIHMESSLFTSDEKDCLQSLSFPEIYDRRENIEAALDSTCTWLFERPDYRDWLNRQRLGEHHGLLWIKGKPGSGKSTLMKQALLRAEQTSYDNAAIVGFFFNARGSLLEQTPLGLFRSLIHQLLQKARHLLSKLLPIFRKKRDTLGEGWKWHLDELREFFRSAIIQPHECSIVVFVDALDECSESSARSILSFFEDSTALAVSAGACLNICISSRHYPNMSIEKCLEVCVEHKNYSDISTYVQTKLRSKLPYERSDELKWSIVRKASSVFLWVKLVVDMLVKAKEDGETMKRMQEIVQSVPAELDDLFAKTLRAIGDADKPETLRMMQWILLAQRPLSLTELRFAMAFCTESPYPSQKSWQISDDYVKDDEQFERLLRNRCRGLAEVKRTQLYKDDFIKENHLIETEATVQFIHESVRDFLVNKKGFQLLDPCIGETAIGKGHDQLKQSCLNYINIGELHSVPQVDPQKPSWLITDRLDDILTTYPFMDYTVSSVFIHAQKAESEGISQKDLLESLRWPTERIFQCWKYFHDLIYGQQDHISQGPQTTLLHIASQYNLLGCVITLLQSRVDVHTEVNQVKNFQNKDPSREHEAVIRLLEYEVNVNVKDDGGNTALHRAARNGHEAVVRLLLEHNADVDGKNVDGETALHLAAAGEYEAVVLLLLDNGASFSEGTGNGETTLSFAARKGLDIRAPLLYAVAKGCEGVVRLLLKKGAEINTQNGKYGSALNLAARNRNEVIVRLLLENGADITAKDSGGRTALHWSAGYGHEEVVQLLLKHGANVADRTNTGETALHWAAGSGYGGAVRLLLREGADFAVKDNGGRTALYRAAFGRHEDVARQLQMNGADAIEMTGSGISVSLPRGLVGLQNLGNTGWLNSVLQILRLVPELQMELERHTVYAASESSKSNYYLEFEEIDLALYLRDLFRQMSKAQEAVSPLTFINALELAFPELVVKSETGSGYERQDAGRVWEDIYIALDWHLAVEDPVSKRQSSCLEKYLSGELECVIDFEDPSLRTANEGPLRSSEPFHALHCMNESSTNNLYDDILFGFDRRVLKRSTAHGRDVTYNKTIRISRLPMYLTVMIPGFYFDIGSSKTKRTIDGVAFPLVLDVTGLCNEELKSMLLLARSLRDVVSNKRKLGEGIEDQQRISSEVDAEDPDRVYNISEMEANCTPSISATKRKGFSDEGVNNTGLYELIGMITRQGVSTENGKYATFVKKDAPKASQTEEKGAKSGKWWLLIDDAISEANLKDIEILASGDDGLNSHSGLNSAIMLLYRAIPSRLPVA